MLRFLIYIYNTQTNSNSCLNEKKDENNFKLLNTYYKNNGTTAHIDQKKVTLSCTIQQTYILFIILGVYTYVSHCILIAHTWACSMQILGLNKVQRLLGVHCSGVNRNFTAILTVGSAIDHQGRCLQKTLHACPRMHIVAIRYISYPA